MEQDTHDSHLEEQIMGKMEETQVQKVKNKRKRLQSDLGDNSDKRGVCYLSRVPPNMNPSHIRQLLSSFGEIQRLYLAPEGNKFVPISEFDLHMIFLYIKISVIGIFVLVLKKWKVARKINDKIE